MAYETIIVDIADHVAVIRLNRPEALNAINGQLLSELCAALEDADQRLLLRRVCFREQRAGDEFRRQTQGDEGEGTASHEDPSRDVRHGPPPQ